ncbi:MAG: RDD family protein [Ostreibacterium sp.]
MIGKTVNKNNKTILISMGRRLGAMLYDWLLCFACLFVFVGITVTLNKGNAVSSQQQPFLTLGLLGVIFIYFVGFWRQGGQTPGMKVWKIRLTADSPPANVNKLLLRFLVVLLTLGVAIIPGFFRADKKGWHDIISKTSLRFR